MKETLYTRQQLYDLVWSIPIGHLSKDLITIDAKLRKVCEEMKIPIPSIGYWTKKRHGNNIEPPVLPMDYEGQESITFPLPEVISKSTPIEQLTKEIENTPGLPLKVPDKLTNLHRLIISAKNSMTGRSSYNWYSELISTPRYEGQLNICVAQPNINRALRFMDALIKLMMVRGHDLVIHNHEACALMYGEKIELKMREVQKKGTPRKDGHSFDYIATGKLKLSIGYKWRAIEIKDGKFLIEDQLAKALAVLEIEGQKERKNRLEYEESERIRKEKEQIAKEQRELKKKEFKKFKTLLKTAKRWEQAQFIRACLNDIEKNASNNNTLNKELKDWIHWARNKADWFDPLIHSKDEILDDYETEKKNLSAKNPYRYY